MQMTCVLAFHKVATAGSFTVAARIAGVSQPTLSTQVRSLERSIGATLFERGGRQIRLTMTGEALLQATSKLSAAMEEIARVAAQPKAEARGMLRVSADSALHVIPILADMKRKSKKFAFSIRVDNSAQVIAQILREEADVGVMAQPCNDARLHTAKIRKDHLVLLAAKSHPLAQRKVLRLSELAGQDLIVRERGSITRDIIQTRLAAGDIRPAQMLDVATREAVREAVAAGFGVGVVFSSEAGDDRRLTTIEIRGADLAVGEYVICRADRKNVGLVSGFLETALRLAKANRWLGNE
jgi:LysR family transcriptional regulator, low CO2-responsive transcriptional regulator